MSLDLRILQVPKDFPWGGSRHGTTIDTVVYHFTDGHHDDPQDVANTWIRPPSGAPPDQKWGRQASAHYINPRNGQLALFMPEEWAAWHCFGVNVRSIGIENCAFDGDALTPDQEQRLVQLTQDIMGRYPITRITGHRFADSRGTGATNCPGALFGASMTASIAEQKSALSAWIAKFFGSVLAQSV